MDDAGEVLVGNVEFRVGRFTLRPSRQLLENGEPVSIGRKALELITVLAKADGALVTKDELMAAVWPNAVVEENAIHVHMAALRKVLGDDAELLCTVHGLGYRLAVTEPLSPARAPSVSAGALNLGRWPLSVLKPDPPAGETEVAAAGARPRRPFPWRTAAAALLAAGLAAGTWIAAGRPGWPRPAEGVAVATFDSVPGDPQSRSVADGVADAMAGALAKVDLKSLPANAGSELTPLQRDAAAARTGAAFVLGGRVRRDGDTLYVSAAIDDVQRHETLWSGNFTRPAAQAEALQEQVAARVVNLLHCMVDAKNFGGKVPADGLNLYLRACDAIAVEPDDQVRGLFRQVVERIPGFANGWGSLAVASAFTAQELPPDMALAARREAQAAADRALQLDPKNGMAYVALEALQDQSHLWQRAQLLRRGLAVAPDNALLNHHQAELLSMVGSETESVAYDRRAASLQPLFPHFVASLISNLAASGQLPEARALTERAVRIWPDNDEVLGDRIANEAEFGDPRGALELMADPRTLPPTWDQSTTDVWRAFSAARLNPSTVKTYAQGVLARVRAGRMDASNAVRSLSTLGATDAAFAAAQSLTPGFLYTEPLFRPTAAGMRRDPRFMPLAAKLGLVDFWKRSGQWPDFCLAQDRPYDCRAEAAKLGA